MQVNEANGGSLRKIQMACICLLVCVLTFGGVYQLLYTKPTYSEWEKRDLAQLPTLTVETLFSGDYFRGIDIYYADTFPFREFFVTLSAGFNELKGIVYDDIVLYGDPVQKLPDAPLAPTQTQPVEPAASTAGGGGTSPSPSGPEPPPSSAGPALPAASASSSSASEPADEQEDTIMAPPEQINNVIIYDGQGYDSFGGSDTVARRYAKIVSDYQDLMPNANIYNILVPTHSQINLRSTKYGKLVGDQQPDMMTIYNSLDSRVHTVNILPTLEMHKDEYLYFATDHHWTADGAFYAYELYCAVTGQTALTREQFTKTENEGFLGSFYAFTKDRRLKENPDTVVTYQIPYDVAVTNYDKNGVPFKGFLVNPSNNYLAFLGGDNPFMSITTSNKNGKKLLIIKESFGNAFATIVAGNYEQIFVADGRYCPFNIVSLVNDYAVDDVIFINNMFAACTSVRVEEIARLKNKTMQYKEPVAAEAEAALP